MVSPLTFFSRKVLEQRKFFVLLQPDSKGFIAKNNKQNRIEK